MFGAKRRTLPKSLYAAKFRAGIFGDQNPATMPGIASGSPPAAPAAYDAAADAAAADDGEPAAKAARLE